MKSFKMLDNEGEIKEAFINYLEAKYDCKLTAEARRVFSVCGEEAIFYGDDTGFRIMSQNEILNAKDNIINEDMKLIPIIDYYDNDYLVYIVENKKWGFYHCIDNLIFREFDTFKEFLIYFNKS